MNFGKINIKYNCYNAIFSQKLSFLLFFVLKNAMTVAKRLAALSTVNLTFTCDWRWDARSNKLLSVILCIQVFFYQIILIKSMNVINACLVCCNAVCACRKRICKTFSKLILFKNQWIVFLCFVYVMFMFCLNKLFKHFMCLLFIGNFS